MILVAGATGSIGSKVLRRLSEAGVETWALSHNPNRGETLPHVEWAEADLAAPETLPPVFESVARLFLVAGNSESMVQFAYDYRRSFTEHDATSAAKRSEPAHQ